MTAVLTLPRPLHCYPANANAALQGTGRPGPPMYASLASFARDLRHNRLLLIPALLYAVNNSLRFAMQVGGLRALSLQLWVCMPLRALPCMTACGLPCGRGPAARRCLPAEPARGPPPS